MDAGQNERKPWYALVKLLLAGAVGIGAVLVTVADNGNTLAIGVALLLSGALLIDADQNKRKLWYLLRKLLFAVEVIIGVVLVTTADNWSTIAIGMTCIFGGAVALLFL